MGASRVVCVDRFVTWRDPAQQQRIYAALAERMDAEDRARLADVLAPDGAINAGQDRLVLIEGTGVEDADRALAPASFDAVISRAVLAHVYEPARGFAAMDRLLVPGGRVAHKVDLSDHRLFSDAGHNPLTFLTIPDWIYDRMRKHTGLTNRRLIDWYRARFAELGYEAEFLVTRVIGAESELSPPVPYERLAPEIDEPRPLVEQIRPRLLERFAPLPDEDLAAADMFLRASKPI
jgi:SAM-dependent methyltransferase